MPAVTVILPGPGSGPYSLALWLATLVVGLDMMVLSVALTSLSRDLGATTAELQWITDAYTLALAVVAAAGRAARRPARSPHRAAGRTARLRCRLRRVRGGPHPRSAHRRPRRARTRRRGSAVGAPVGTADGVRHAGRGRAMSIMVSGMMLGLPLGPVLGGYLLEHFWWGSVFLINVPVVAGRARRRRAGRTGEPGTAWPHGPTWAVWRCPRLGLVALVYGIIEGPDPRLERSGGAGCAWSAAYCCWPRSDTGSPAPPSRCSDCRCSPTGASASAWRP